MFTYRDGPGTRGPSAGKVPERLDSRSHRAPSASWMMPLQRLLLRPVPTSVLSAVSLLVVAMAALCWTPGALDAQTLRGGTASLDRQNHQAHSHGFTYLDTPDQVRQFVASGYLVPVVPNRDFDVHNVSFPYARPEVNLFIQRLAAQYRSACGEKLVVTSLTRPRSNQPWNASSRSVHPTGMAVDLRRSGNASCRNWLERTLLALEREGLLEAIYERNPPHYHVAVYPQPYATYVAQMTGNDAVVANANSGDTRVETEWVTHRVRRGETLSGIGDRYGVAISRIRAENRIQGSRILVGQELRIPVYRTVAVTASADAPSPAAESSPEPTARSLPAAAAAEDLALDDGGAPGDPAPSAAPAASYESAESAQSGTRTASGTPAVHRVGRGESLWTIARLYGVSEGELRTANGIRGSRILAGQELQIPVTNGATAELLRHTVANGESLWIIARRHGVTVEDLRRTNRIGSSRIHPGQVLDIPVSR
jgi:LysM repeat protein